MKEDGKVGWDELDDIDDEMTLVKWQKDVKVEDLPSRSNLVAKSCSKKGRKRSTFF